MSSTVTVVHAFNKVPIKVTPNTLLSQILAQACTKLNIDPSTCALFHNRKALDGSDSVRFANLPAGANLELRASAATNAALRKLTVVLQLPNGERVSLPEPCTGSDTFATILSRADAKLGGTGDATLVALRSRSGVSDPALHPSVQPVSINQQITGPELDSTTLATLNLSGRVLIRVSFVSSGRSTTEIDTPMTDAAPAASLNDGIDTTSTEPRRSLLEDQAKDEELRARQRAAAEARARPSQAKSTNLSSSSNNTAGTGSGTAQSSTSSGPSTTTPAATATTKRGPCPRDIRVFDPPAADAGDSGKIELPPDFFELSRDDLAAINSIVKKRAENGGILQTKHMRDLKERERRARYPKTLVRFRFPDRVQVQCAFWSTEKVSDLVTVVKGVLGPSSPGFYLFTAPPMRKFTNKDASSSLWTAEVAPACVVRVGWADGDASRSTIPILKSEYASKLEPLPPPTDPIKAIAPTTSGQTTATRSEPTSGEPEPQRESKKQKGPELTQGEKERKLKGFIKL